MKPSLAIALRLLWRFLLVWLIETSAIVVLAARFPGVSIGTPQYPLSLLQAAFLAFALSAVNTAISPTIILLRLPLNVFTVGITAITLNSALLYISSRQLPGFDIQPFLPTAVTAAFLMIALNTLLTAVIVLDDEFTYFQFALHVFSRDRSLRRALQEPNGAAGIIIVQIDGLAPQFLDQALNSGQMPFLKSVLDAGTHKAEYYDCGLPSQTSAAQAGIMYGNNANIPAFRWYDKQHRRMIVSNHPADANRINLAISTGSGLLRGGSSINNLINGDAARSLLTMSTLTGSTGVPTIRALDDLGSFWFNPYTFTRTVLGIVGDMFAETFQALRQWLLNEFPRMDRLFSGQIFLRVLTNVFFRDLSAYVAMLDICRGVPIIYTTFMGYDQVAHHVGPHKRDAIRTLRGLDRSLRHIQQTIRLFAPRPYQLVILSDHGQSFGMTFLQRYGISLRDLVVLRTSRGVDVAESNTYEDKQSYVTALVQELNAASQQMESQPNARFRRAVIRQTTRKMERSAAAQTHESMTLHSHIVVCSSGNLAHIYLDIYQTKVPLDLIEQLHPGLAQSLVEHPGVGFICAYLSNGEVVIMGKAGARNLITGALTGIDPLGRYGNVEIRAEQLLRLAEFENSGDLIVSSTLYDDGTVASFENLIGIHGGLGGQQTDAFIIAPTDWRVDTRGITNTYQLYEILSRQRAKEE